MEIDIKAWILLLIAFLTAQAAWKSYSGLVAKVHKLTDDFKKLAEKVEQMEKAERLRMPYKAFEEIMHGMAALDVRDREVEFEKTVLDNARAHFANALKVGTKREE